MRAALNCFDLPCRKPAIYIGNYFFRARLVNMAIVGKAFKKKVKKGVKRVARTQGRITTTVGKVSRSYGKVADNVGGAMKVVGTVTGQPQVAAAGATLQKSGQVSVVGGRTAVAAGRAQKKLVRGKRSAALQKLGHAGRNAMAVTTLAR